MEYHQKYKGLSIADYFVKKCIEQNIPVTNMSILNGIATIPTLFVQFTEEIRKFS